MSSAYRISLLTLLALQLSACAAAAPQVTPTPGPSRLPTNGVDDTPATTLPVLSLEEQAQIYAAVVAQVVSFDNTVGEPIDLDHLFIVTQTGMGIQPGWHIGVEAGPEDFSTDLQSAIVDRLPIDPRTLSWVASVDEAIQVTPDDHADEPHYMAITMSQVGAMRDGTLRVYAQNLLGPLTPRSMASGGGQIYVLERIDGLWVITGNTGPRWIS